MLARSTATSYVSTRIVSPALHLADYVTVTLLIMMPNVMNSTPESIASQKVSDINM